MLWWLYESMIIWEMFGGWERLRGFRFEKPHWPENHVLYEKKNCFFFSLKQFAIYMTYVHCEGAGRERWRWKEKSDTICIEACKISFSIARFCGLRTRDIGCISTISENRLKSTEFCSNFYLNIATLWYVCHRNEHNTIPFSFATLSLLGWTDDICCCFFVNKMQKISFSNAGKRNI